MLFAVLLLSSCRPVYIMMDDEDAEFTLSDKRVDDILPALRDNPVPKSIQGRARVQLSTPEEQERLIVQFAATHDESALRIRNTLGIEGGRIHMTQDSMLIYDRLKSSAWKVSREEGEMFFVQGISGINIMEILYPDFSEDFRSRIHESEHSYLLRTQSGKQYIISKEDYSLQKVILQDTEFRIWHEFNFSHHQHGDGYHYPARVQILSSDRKSNIFMLIQSVEFNPSDLHFSPDIPENIPVERL